MKKTILLLLVAFGIILSSAPNVQSQNLMINGDMETWTGGLPDGWTTVENISQETLIFNGGSSSAKHTAETATKDLNQVVAVTGGTIYTIKYYYLDNDPNARTRIWSYWMSGTTLLADNLAELRPSTYSTDDPSWQEYNVTLQAPATADVFRFEVRVYNEGAGGGFVYYDDFLVEEGGTIITTINDAWAISDAELDLVYNVDQTSVDPNDYSLTGTSTILFSTATIDGADSKLVHLSGANSTMTGDITLDLISDGGSGASKEFYAGIMPIAYTNTTNTGGTMLDTYTATFQGVVTANDNFNNVWIHDAENAYNGLLIYSSTFQSLVAVGDEVRFKATRGPYNNLTEVVNPVLISNLSSSNPVNATNIQGADINEDITADTDPGEKWEGQLVKIDNFTIESYTDFDYRCSFIGTEGTTYFHIGDNVDYQFGGITLTVGQTYPSITGVIDWEYDLLFLNYRINPRNQYDIEGSIAPATQLGIISVNGGTDPDENTNFSVVVQVQDVNGNPTLASGNINFTLTTDGGDLMNVGFVPATPLPTGTILDGTSEITVTGVQMSPSGTNVTITANDDAVLLTSGQSAPFNVVEGLSYIIYQGFEESGDSWNYTTDPPPYHVGADVWDAVSSLSSISPVVGDRFWGMQDLENANGGGDFWHTMNFAPVDISLYGGVQLSFQYYTIGYDGTDEMGYAVEFDNGTTWSDTVMLEKNTLAWTSIEIPIPSGSNYVRLLLLAKQNGGSDYAGWDDVKLIETASNPPTKLAIISVNGGTNPYESTDFNVVVQTQNVGGSPAAVSADLDFTLTPNGGTVDFVVGTTTTGTIAAGTSAVVLSGVQMAPTGTNVTITAVDDNPFGLMNGTSAPFDVVEFVLPEIIITEVMQDPFTVSDSNGEWFEVFNNSDTPVDMIGWIMKDLGSNEHTILSSVIVPAKGFAVLGNNNIPATNGGYTCDYEFANFFLGNTDDEIILYMPDGITEINRVEWDGGTLWPDPIGSSMVFAGFNGEDNNDGTNWVTAYRREASFVDVGDNGSPGSIGYQQLLAGGFKLNLKAFLEGPYDTDLNVMVDSIFIPQPQPFYTVPYYGNLTPKWLYTGSDRYSNFNGTETDWVLIELRDATTAANAGSAATIDTRPAMLLDDGSIVALNGFSDLSLNFSVTNNLFIVIWQRNHLGIMSSTGLNPVSGTVSSYDFTTGSDKVYGAAMGYIELEPGVWGMVTGDVNADGTVDINDKADGWSTDVGMHGYLGGDLDLSGESNNQDKNDNWLPNENTNSQVPN